MPPNWSVPGSPIRRIGQGDVAGSTVADVEADPGYTVPQQIDEQLRQYYLSHGNSSSELGANGMNTRLVTLRISEETLVEEEEPEEIPDRSPP